ncbi:sigma-70 family RNA polymerase sigma factor [Aquabacterium sp. A7-Y]|uniref:sigma-70 family RNA polymerase sigma factor n=1 Tax=Aquabacterium sp. A7-Y TaxID=1349605 RepID=UPI00223D34EF|nr:sigma-70 family RNA polymerase sigma factor [Aquabacterium sp. A7-Y]MCW7540863.1 sigma-70 family RNA polymerase sigma factor [Aquabacterium sp. A7-Y]
MPSGEHDLPSSRDGAQDASNRLVLDNLPLVRMIAARLYRLRWGDAVGFDDYLQYGHVGLVEAARRYRPGGGAQFSSYASWRITGAILNGLENATEQHQQIAARKRLVEERANALAEAADAAPAGGEEDLEAALARIADVAIGLAVGFMLEGSGMYSDSTEVVRRDGYASLATRQARAALQEAVSRLPERERQVVQGHYFEQRPFMEIANTLSLTKGRVSQLHKQALERLRAVLGEHDGEAFDA